MKTPTTTRGRGRDREWGTIAAAADRLNCSPKTVRRRISEGEITAYRMGKRMIRVDLNEIDTMALREIPTVSSGAA